MKKVMVLLIVALTTLLVGLLSYQIIKHNFDLAKKNDEPKTIMDLSDKLNNNEYDEIISSTDIITSSKVKHSEKIYYMIGDMKIDYTGNISKPSVYIYIYIDEDMHIDIPCGDDSCSINYTKGDGRLDERIKEGRFISIDGTREEIDNYYKTRYKKEYFEPVYEFFDVLVELEKLSNTK